MSQSSPQETEVSLNGIVGIAVIAALLMVLSVLYACDDLTDDEPMDKRTAQSSHSLERCGVNDISPC